MSNELSTSSSRQEACSLVLGGLESLREGLIMYHELGLSTKEIYADLKAAGWDKSIHFLRRQETAMRKEGLLPQSELSKAATKRETVRKTAHEPVENSTPLQAEPEMAPINLSTYVQPEEFIQPERTSELYNFLSTELSKLNDLIYSNHGNFSDDEYRSLCGTAYHIYINLRTKCDHLERIERNRTESYTIDSTQV